MSQFSLNCKKTVKFEWLKRRLKQKWYIVNNNYNRTNSFYASLDWLTYRCMARKSCISVLIKLFCLPLEFKNYFYWISSVLISFSFAVKGVHVVWQQGFTCVDSSVLLLFSKHTEILSINFCNRKFNIIQIKI